jgi:hypothetical protein
VAQEHCTQMGELLCIERFPVLLGWVQRSIGCLDISLELEMNLQLLLEFHLDPIH